MGFLLLSDGRIHLLFLMVSESSLTGAFCVHRNYLKNIKFREGDIRGVKL